jgi:hypothetical protein
MAPTISDTDTKMADVARDTINAEEAMLHKSGVPTTDTQSEAIDKRAASMQQRL